MSAARDVDGPALAGPFLGGIAGFIDGVDIPRFHVFGAAMTGNTALLGIRLGGAEHASPAIAFLPIVGFFFGCMLARVLLDRVSATWPLLVEVALLAGAAASPPLLVAAFVATAFAMGVQNTTYASFGGVKANTTFITGDYDRLAQAVVESFRPGEAKARQTVALVAPLVVVYGLGALAGGIAEHAMARPLWIPAGLVLGFALLRARATRAVPTSDAERELLADG